MFPACYPTVARFARMQAWQAATRMVDIETAVERLLTAYVAAGGTSNFDPADEEDLAGLRTFISPLHLPDQIEYVWRRYQEEGPPGALDMMSLGTVEMAIGAAPYTDQSRALLTIGSGGGRLCYLELNDADGLGGGAVWTLEEFAPQMHEVAPSLAALLDATATAWELGIVRLSKEHPFPWAAWDEPAWHRLKAEVLPAGRVASSRPAGWLPRWLAAEGLTADAVRPRGPTTTIGALLGRGEAWTGIATIRGRVRSLGSTITAVSAMLDDGTGEIAVYVPAIADPSRLLSLDRELEVDVRRFPAGTEVEPPFETGDFAALAVRVRDNGP